MVIGTNSNLSIVEACYHGRVLGDDLATLVIVSKLRKESAANHEAHCWQLFVNASDW
jgi:hypothetical protein